MNRRQLCEFCVISERQQPSRACFQCDPGRLPYMAGYKIAILLTRGYVQALPGGRSCAYTGLRRQQMRVFQAFAYGKIQNSPSTYACDGRFR